MRLALFMCPGDNKDKCNVVDEEPEARLTAWGNLEMDINTITQAIFQYVYRSIEGN